MDSWRCGGGGAAIAGPSNGSLNLGAWELGMVYTLPHDERPPANFLPGQDDREPTKAEHALHESADRMHWQNEAFQATIRGAPLEESLGILARIVTDATPEALFGFHIADADGARLHPVRIASGMPSSYMDLVDDFPIGEDSLGCGLALATGEAVLSRDVFEDERWRRLNLLDLARKYGVRACWSFPIVTRDSRPVGTFYRYFADARDPTPDDLAVARMMTQAAAIIISHHTETQKRAQAEEMQRVLTSELAHRVKNMLATVQAVAAQTLRHNKNPEEFVATFAGRIQSMSRVHSLLSEGDWQRADLRDLIRDQILLGPVDETRVAAGGPPVRLDAHLAPQVAMMLHELGTNSIKYGALSKADGMVTISWTVSDRMLCLRWTERGGPLVKAPVRRGFGARLIEQSAKGAGGGARMLIGNDGVEWDITVNLPRPNAASASANTVQKTEFIETTPRRAEAVDANLASPVLAGKRFLVVDDEPLVALDLAETLRSAGVEVIASTGSSREALQVIADRQLDAALLDGNLHGEPVDEIAAALTRYNIPFLFVSGYDKENLPRAHQEATLLSKPFSDQQMLEAAARLLAQDAGGIRSGEK